MERVGSPESSINLCNIIQYNLSKYGKIHTVKTYQVSRYRRLPSIEILYTTYPVEHQQRASRSCLYPEMGYVPQGMHSEQAASDVSKDYFALRKPTCFTYPHCVPWQGEAWRRFCTTRVYSLCFLSATDLSPGHMYTPENKRDIFRKLLQIIW
jgi:hypothetical protein